MHASGDGSSYSVAGNNATLMVALTFSGTFIQHLQHLGERSHLDSVESLAGLGIENPC
jgi:hypothetical protein